MNQRRFWHHSGGTLGGYCGRPSSSSTITGRFLAARMTWLSVVIGIGVDLLILALVIPLDALIAVVAVIGVSSLPIITRSLINESMDSRKFCQMNHERNEPTHPKADPE